MKPHEALHVALMLLAALVVLSCIEPARTPLEPPQARTVALVSETWRALHLRWHPSCDTMLGRLQIDEDVGRCSGEPHGCIAEGAIHLEPGAPPSLLVHELWHALHLCARVGQYGDPLHASGLWRTPGVDPRQDDTAEARAVRRVIGAPEPNIVREPP